MDKIKADKILVGNKVFTGLKDICEEKAIVIKGNKIEAVVDRKDMDKYTDSCTEVIDYGENLIMPGFHDCHVHIFTGCLFYKYPNLSKAKSESEAVEMLKEYYDKNPEKKKQYKWILGFMWYNFWWEKTDFPTRESLDKAFPDDPVFLLNSDGHGAWVNSKALEICGVNENTEDVPFGTIFRDENGAPTGYLEEDAMSLCKYEAYKFTTEQEVDILKDYLKEIPKYGITSMNDMFGINQAGFESFKALETENQLKVRINIAGTIFEDEEKCMALKEKYHDGKVNYNGVKQFLDGVIVTHTSVMLDNYLDKPEANKNFPLCDYSEVEELIIKHHKKGTNIHLHATGDGAVRFALDSYEKAIKVNGNTGSRLSIEHCDFVDSEDFKRFGELGVIASIQPPHLAAADTYSRSPYLKTVGSDREKRLWAFRTMLDNNAVLAMGTDYPVVDIDPKYGIYRAVTRLFEDKTPEGGFYPEQKLKMADILRAYTYGSAYKNNQENILGTLEEGKLADIAVIDRDLFSIEPEEILDMKVMAAFCDGEMTYKCNK